MHGCSKLLSPLPSFTFHSNPCSGDQKKVLHSRWQSEKKSRRAFRMEDRFASVTYTLIRSAPRTTFPVPRSLQLARKTLMGSSSGRGVANETPFARFYITVFYFYCSSHFYNIFSPASPATSDSPRPLLINLLYYLGQVDENYTFPRSPFLVRANSKALYTKRENNIIIST